jgi:transposase
MAITDSAGLPIAVHVASASPHEITLIDDTFDAAHVKELPPNIIGDKAYDSDRLDKRLLDERGIRMIAPARDERRRTREDGRRLRRYKRRWKVERLFSWLFNFRRLVTRYEWHVSNYQGFLHLACIIILLRQF